MTDTLELAYDGTQATYHAIRRLQAAETARLIPSATPWPKAPTGAYAWKLRPEPGTFDGSELADA